MSLRRAVIYGPFPGEQTANLPNVGQQVAADAVFVKYLPGVKDVPMPVFVAPRLQYPASGPLGRLDFDLAMFDGTGDNAPLTAADSAAFYCLLGLTRTADSDRFGARRLLLTLLRRAPLFRSGQAAWPIVPGGRNRPTRGPCANRRSCFGRAVGD